MGTALQEAVINAVVQRDYEITGSQIIFRLFPDRIEIQNPGGLHNTLTEEALFGAIFALNRLINTGGGDTYTFFKVKVALKKAGFKDKRLLRTGEKMDCLLEGRKPVLDSI